MENRELIEFINNNNLSLKGTGSGLNSECCILAGYSLYLKYISATKVIEEAKLDKTNNELIEEFTRVFNFAKNNNYGDYWTTEEAKNMYVIIE